MPASDWEEAAQAALAWGCPLDAETIERAKRYLALVLLHNGRVNLTADASEELLVRRHLADGLAGAGLLKAALSGRPAPRLADLGSGAGFIGIGLKLGWPQAEVTLVEPLTKRFNFLSAAAAALGVKGLRVLRQSASGKPLAGVAPFDAVAFRALAPLPEALRLALPLVAAGGFALAYQSQPADPEEPALKKSLAAGGARLVECRPYRLPREGQDRYLALFKRD